MVNFAPAYVSAARNHWEADHAAERTRFNSPPYAGLYIGQPERAKAALAEWEAQHPMPVTTLAQVADHIEHIRQVAGVDHVGIGSDFDGIPDAPVGLEGVDRYPALLEELMRRGWSDADIAKLAGENLLRRFGAAEQVSLRLQRRLEVALISAVTARPVNAAGGRDISIGTARRRDPSHPNFAGSARRQPAYGKRAPSILVVFPLRTESICSRAIDITISTSRIMRAAMRLRKYLAHRNEAGTGI